jgi:hypothetical protein
MKALYAAWLMRWEFNLDCLTMTHYHRICALYDDWWSESELCWYMSQPSGKTSDHRDP